MESCAPSPQISPGVGAVVELDAGEAACQLAAARDPADGAALVKQVDGVKQLLALLLDQAHTQDLALVIRDKLGGQHLRELKSGRAVEHQREFELGVREFQLKFGVQKGKIPAPAVRT